MATVTCPSCGLPRAPDLIDAAACPVCGSVGGVAEVAPPVSDSLGASTPSATEPHETGGLRPPLAPSSGRVAGPAFGFAAGVAVGVGGLLGWQNLPTAARPAQEPPAVAERPVAVEQPKTGSPRPAVAVAPVPREVVARAAAPADRPGGLRQPSAGNTDPVAWVNEPPARPAEAVPGEPAALVLDNPDGTSSPYVRPGGTLILRGRVGKLVVSGLDGGAVLDCSALDAAEVVVTAPVGGGSRLLARCPTGRVTFIPPGGTAGGAIGGGAVVELEAREVGFHARIDGDGTRVKVRLTDPGVLTLGEVNGPARVEYGRANPGGPEPKVIPGRVGPGAVVRKVE